LLLVRDGSTFPLERYPMMVWQANLWGRAVYNLVLRRSLEEAQGELKKANVALDHELKTVGEVQRSLLPTTLPRIRDVELAAYYETSARAGGDYYDIFPCASGRFGILVADVSGHGASAAVV